MQLGTSTNNRWILSYALMGMGQALVESDPTRAVRLLAAGAELRQVVGSVLYAADPSLLERSTRKAREALDAAAFERAWGEGRAMTLEEALDTAVPGGFFRGLDR
jgi:hypothetical protein